MSQFPITMESIDVLQIQEVLVWLNNLLCKVVVYITTTFLLIIFNMQFLIIDVIDNGDILYWLLLGGLLVTSPSVPPGFGYLTTLILFRRRYQDVI